MEQTAPSRSGGAALIGAPLVTIIIMLIHPTGHDLAADLERVAVINAVVHGSAIAAMPVILLGLMALSRRLGHADAAVAGCVAYGVCAIAWMIAAIASGFLQTEIYRGLAETPDSASLDALSHYTWWLNQSMAGVGVIASSIAIGLFGLPLLRKSHNLLGGAALVAGIGAFLLYALGVLDLDVHGFGIIVFLQTAWLISAGVFLLRR